MPDCFQRSRLHLRRAALHKLHKPRRESAMRTRMQIHMGREEVHEDEVHDDMRTCLRPGGRVLLHRTYRMPL